MRTKLLGIFESVQRCAITDSRTATEKSVRAHHKELMFSVAVREVATLGAYLAIGASRGVVGRITRRIALKPFGSTGRLAHSFHGDVTTPIEPIKCFWIPP